MLKKNSMEDTLYIVMPAYNEEGSIQNVVKEWYPQLSFGSSDSRLVVADSGSTDRTHEMLSDMAANEYPQLVILETAYKQHGPKLIALYKYGIKHGADYVFQTDSDGQTCPEEFFEFWKLRKTNGAVLGCRRKRGDGTARKIVENVVCLLLYFYFKVKVPDANAPFRLMHRAVLAKYVNRFPEDYNLPNIMLTAWMAYYKDPIEFKDISFAPRTTGKNSINLKKIFKIGWKSLSDFRKFSKETKKHS